MVLFTTRKQYDFIKGSGSIVDILDKLKISSTFENRKNLYKLLSPRFTEYKGTYEQNTYLTSLIKGCVVLK